MLIVSSEDSLHENIKTPFLEKQKSIIINLLSAEQAKRLEML